MLGRHAHRNDGLQVGNPGNHIKVGVTVDDTRTVADRERRYEAVVDASNRFAGAPGGAIDTRGSTKVNRVINVQRRQAIHEPL